ncbi:MAG: DNA-directed RNA polymerase subunit beta [Alphaproteobacteria bacterium]|nr:DNA-directed RNA polymerase subunit beta [Alphaproteobacteria bacterium]
MFSDLFVRNIQRRSFSKIPQVAKIPNLIEIQKESYEKFLQSNIAPKERKNTELQGVFNSVFPINDYAGTCTLEFASYRLDKPKYDVEESKQRSISYVAPLKATLRLVIWETDPDLGTKDVKGIKEQEVYMGDVPLMTNNATFVINGVERVIVSQMHRSPGVFFDHDKGKTHSSGKYLYLAHVIPYRGSWLDFEFDAKDILYFRIDKRRKLPVSTLLMAMGMSAQDIYNFFYKKAIINKVSKGWSSAFNPDDSRSFRLSKDLIDAKTGKVVAKKDTRLNKRSIKQLKDDGLKEVLVSSEELVGKFLASDLEVNAELSLTVGDELTLELIEQIEKAKIKSIEVLDINHYNTGPYIRNTLKIDKNATKEEALIDIFRVVRPGEPTTFEAAEALFESLFFDSNRYDLSVVGRIKLNAKMGLKTPEEHTTLKKEDIINIIQYLVNLKDGVGEIDDIDHLGNRRIRSVGELVENQFRLAFVRLERTIIERMASMDVDTIMPNDLINSKLLANVIKEFFGTSQFSQFMDQTNPLSEITHKRRLSALGPGGLTRDRAGMDVRDVHTSHYGRVCPIETPEGQNIGLINSLASFAQVNQHGFIESPYRKVVKGKVTNEVVYLSAVEEKDFVIAQANANINSKGDFSDSLVSSRRSGEFILSEPSNIDFMDVTPMQLVSIATALIPFLENDDASRALMGSNMQRQAVPLISTEAPFVGTGIEGIVASDSGATITAVRDGIVDKVDSTRIVVKSENEEEGAPEVNIYNLIKFQRSNYNTCLNQKPLVRVGDQVKKGEVIADGPSTDRGDLALGRNALVAFMPWNGYNFEDSILISERIVKEDVFTSIHIEEFSVVARDTKLGPEEITRDIPNISEESLRCLDETGIVYKGAEVKPGDILVGKVTPKSESPMTPEEKLLKAIFGEKAADVKDSSLHVPPGVSGTVVEVRVFSRRGIEKDQRALTLEKDQIQSLTKDRDDEIQIITDFVFSSLVSILKGQTLKSGPKGIKAGEKLTVEKLESLSEAQLWQIVVSNASKMTQLSALKEKHDSSVKEITERYNGKIEKIQAGDDLAQGVLKEVKIFIAMKHKLQPGDKMAGRHGNKGVISRILPEEDMPYLEDGTVVDIVLNPLGVPSRMNVGQILETHLGWSSVTLGKKIDSMLHGDKPVKALREFLVKIYGDNKELVKIIKDAKDDEVTDLSRKLSKGIFFATPVFDGAKVEDIDNILEMSGVNTSGQVKLIDGRTGEYFDRDITVGYIYMLKLHHLVDDKIHARSIGPYSLVTQQPLGGKAHFGGQRFGEMECWALQAYGAAYTLQEMLTVKSDDVVGRVKIFESIVRGDNNFESGTPESFNVMIKELRSLCLNVELENVK